jgi:tRNA-2-methylthio-N6-dimethylallyladenosine synthase
MKVYLETMGCQMNRLDSELIAGRLRQLGHAMVEDRKSADVVLYNTCSVREHAEQKVLSRLGAHDKRRQAGVRQIVGVVGCMAQREAERLLQRFDSVQVVCAPGQIHRLPELLDDARHGRRRCAADPTRTETPDHSAEAGLDELDLGRDPQRHGAGAYVRITRGCDKFCSYCIVPYTRGPERSRDPWQIAEEVRRLVEAGTTEITLLGQTVNSYRHVAGERTTRFSDLLALLSPTPGLHRLRFVTSHPINFDRDVLDAMRDLPNVCEYIHCPAQSGSDTMLTAMNRKYTRAEYDALVDAARELVPGVVLAGDFIVGFPGETEDDHQASMDLIRRAGYKNSYIFKYSPRPGTQAARRLDDDVPEDVKKRRNNELLAVQREVSLNHHQQYIGQRVEVLVEGRSPKADRDTHPDQQLTGRSRGDHVVVFEGEPSLIGRYVSVTVTRADELTLFAHAD